MERASFGRAEPSSQPLAVADTELGDRVADVKFDGVEADAAPLGDLPIGHPVLDGVNDAPLGGREHVVVRRAASRLRLTHGAILAASRPIFPPLCARAPIRFIAGAMAPRN
jgi:hypothetical protein